MSDYTDDYDDDRNDEAAESSEQTPNPSENKRWRRELEQKAEERGRREAAAEAAAARKELAFLKAGIDLTDPSTLTPQQKLFVKAYDGDVTADAVKAAAVEYGVIDAPPAQVPAEELAGHDRFAQAAAGSQVSQSDGDVYAAALDKAETQADVIAALQAADPNLVDTSNWNAKFAGGGGANTPAVNPL